MPAKPSAKLSGVRRGAAPFSKKDSNAPLVVDPNKLGQITVNRDAIQALTLAQAKVQVTITAGGTTAILVSELDGKPIGGIDDLAKLMSLRSYVTKEKKQTASSETREQMLTATYRLSQKETLKDAAYAQPILDNSFVIAAKPYQIMAENVRRHEKSIEENFNTDEKYKTWLLEYCKLTEGVLVDVLAAMVRGEKEKGLMEDLSLAIGLPSFVRNKLVTKSLALPKDMDLSRVLFPNDPSKGLSFTVKEWLFKGFVQKNGPMLVNSETIMTIMAEESLFLELIGMTAEQYANAEDPKVQRVLKTRISVVPPFEDHRRVLNLLEKQNFRGFGLPATAMDQSKDRLANLCAVPLRAYAFSIRMAENLPDFFDRIFPKGTIKAPDEKLGNYAKQAIAALDKGVTCDLMDIIRGDKNPGAMMSWIARECKIIPDGDLFKKIANCLGAESDAMSLVEVETKDQLAKAPRVTVDVVSKPISKSEIVAIEDFGNSTFSFKMKEEKKKKSSGASSVLLRETKIFLRYVRQKHSEALANSMETYFRGFYAEAVQAAAARIASARFDEFDDDNDVGSSADESTDDEDD